MQILDGKKTSQKILDSLKSEIQTLKNPPRLDIIIVGSDPASQKYVQMKQSKAQQVGITGKIHQLDATSSTSDITTLIKSLNQDPEVTAFMLQLPLPSSINRSEVLESIDPNKDADGLTSKNLGLLFQNNPQAIAPATPKGILSLLEEYQIELSGKSAVIIGRSPIVGIPLSALLTAKNATVTLCHSQTQDLSSHLEKADIIISAVGKANFLNADLVPRGAVLIDVGTNFLDGKLVGDFDYQSLAPSASFITPVPGGVGPMTIASLLQNTLTIYKRSLK